MELTDNAKLTCLIREKILFIADWKPLDFFSPVTWGAIHVKEQSINASNLKKKKEKL